MQKYLPMTFNFLPLFSSCICHLYNGISETAYMASSNWNSLLYVFVQIKMLNKTQMQEIFAIFVYCLTNTCNIRINIYIYLYIHALLNSVIKCGETKSLWYNPTDMGYLILSTFTVWYPKYIKSIHYMRRNFEETAKKKCICFIKTIQHL